MVMTDVLVQPDSGPNPGGEHLEPGAEEPDGKRPPTTGARLWGRVRSKLLRQKVRGDREEVRGTRMAFLCCGFWLRGVVAVGVPRYPLALGRWFCMLCLDALGAFRSSCLLSVCFLLFLLPWGMLSCFVLRWLGCAWGVTPHEWPGGNTAPQCAALPHGG